MKKIFDLIFIFILLIVTTGCESQENEYTNDESVFLVIVEQAWGSRCWNYLEEQADICEFEPQIEIKEVTVGDIITLNEFASYGGTITIKEISSNEVVVKFNTNSVLPEFFGYALGEYPAYINSTRIYDDESEWPRAIYYEWTIPINFNKEYEISTHTLSSGTIWTLTFKRGTA